MPGTSKNRSLDVEKYHRKFDPGIESDYIRKKQKKRKIRKGKRGSVRRRKKRVETYG